MSFTDLLKLEAASYNLELCPNTLAKCQIYYDLLSHWSRSINLTTVSNPLELARFHFLESMVGSRFIRPTDRQYYDLGTGAGFPAVPLRILCSHLSLTMFEPRLKRCIFLKEVIRHLGFDETFPKSISIDREVISSWPFDLDVISFRAIRFSNQVLDALIRHLNYQGRLLIWHGANFPSLEFITQSPSLQSIVSLHFPFSTHRYLSVFERNDFDPTNFPS